MRATTFVWAVVAAVGFIGSPASADSVFEISGNPIAGEDPSFRPHVKAEISIDSGTHTFTILLTNLSEAESAIGQVLTAFLWDLTSYSGTITPVSATLPSDSKLIGYGATSETNVTAEWFFKDNISAGSTSAGPLGEYGAGVMGDINFGADTFGKWDRFDVPDGTHTFTMANLFGPNGPNGVEVGIVGPNISLSSDGSGNPDGFAKQGPVAQNKTLLTFSYTGTLSLSQFTNGQFLFGTDGAPVVPEPGTIALLGLALGAVGVRRWRRRKS